MNASFCRVCPNSCPILVDVEDGRPVRVTGDPASEVYQGYTCVKGRALPQLHNHPDRLLQHQKRMPDGSYVPISSEQLLDELAARLGSIIGLHGGNAVASYVGTMATVSPVTLPIMTAFSAAIGSTMSFNPMTLDQPGKAVAKGLQGAWMAPAQAFNDPDVGLFFGANPLVTYAVGLPAGHPGKWLQRWTDKGLQLVVIDPRRTDTAKRAKIHLQARPGHDVEIVAAILRVILTEERYDKEFVADNVVGVDALAAAVAPFTAELVAERAGIDAAELVEAARIFASGTRGIACAGTGPNMSGSGTLLEYLLLNLLSLCGHWLREGDVVHNPAVVLPTRPPKAQATGPFPSWGLTDPLPGTDLRGSLAGLPTASAPTAMLHDGDDRIRALISVGGNPAAAWPDQIHAVNGLQALDLLVQVDIEMSATARLADYVVAPKMSLELPSVTHLLDVIAVAYFNSGNGLPWAQWTDAVVDVPPGADLLEEWELFYGLGQRLGLELVFQSMMPGTGAPPLTLDMENPPTLESLLERMCLGGRIPLDEVRSHTGGALYPDPPVVVGPKDPDWPGRLDVGNALMMHDLGEFVGLVDGDHDENDEAFPFRMVSRRLMHRYNSSMEHIQAKARRYNPAFMNPDDLVELGLESGDLAEISSSRATVLAVVEPDATLRRGIVSMSHAFGGLPDEDENPQIVGTNSGRLLRADHDLDPYSGQPRMSNVAVAVRPAPVA